MSGGGGGKGGSQTQTTQVEIPKWLENEARRNIDIARDVSQIGYVPYYGPDVAAFSPMQNAAFAGTGQAADAFGLPSGQGGVPEPQTFANGVQGYSSGGLYNQSLDALRQQAPGQYEFMQGMFIDPVTGELSRAPSGQQSLVPPQGMPSIEQRDSGGGEDYQPSPNPDVFNTYQGPNLNGQAGYGLGGYTGLQDMLDGGGAGRSGGGGMGRGK